MALTANIILNVQPLPDSSVWFANAAAWLNYWRNIQAEVVFDAAQNALYTPLALDNTIEFVAINIDGEVYQLVPHNMFNSAMDRLNAMEANYRDLRAEMKAAGFIAEAQ
jgi:hypothetical protein